MKLDTFTSLGMDTIEEKHRRQALLEVGPQTRERPVPRYQPKREDRAPGAFASIPKSFY